MNVYQLFLRSGECHFVLSHDVEIAIRKIEKMTGQFVSCWFIAKSLPSNSNLITRC